MGLNLVILGAGESGVGAALLGKKQGYHVFISDYGQINPIYKDKIQKNHFDFEEGKHSLDIVLNADLVVKSPGIPDSVSVVKKIKEHNIPVISELEFASRYTSATIVGVTGSNGKTTTSMLLFEILKNQGLHVGLAGNIGISFAEQVATKDYTHYVLEVSSFQLDGIVQFKPHISVITNITPDHLDRYDYDFDKYIDAKFRITKNQETSDYFIYDADDEAILSGFKRHDIKAKFLPFSLTKEKEMVASLLRNSMQIKLNETFIMDSKQFSIKGKHNTKNVMAASIAAKLLQARNSVIKESLEIFEGAEHRLEKVRDLEGVQFINDSKATNVNAVFYALECMDKPVIWIAGGVDKGNDYTDLLPLVREKVKAIICIGIDNKKLIQFFDGLVPHTIESEDMNEAVLLSKKLGEKGDTVLLSPACASFDLFADYEDRGRKFKDAVYNL